MSLLVKKIEKSKWIQNDIIKGEDVSADAITICLKTKGNSLSTWNIQNEADIKDAVLAIVSNGDQLDTIDVVCLSKNELQILGVSLVQTPGITPVKPLVNIHYDISELTYKSLGLIAEKIVECFKQDKVIRITRVKIKNIIQDAISEGRLEKSDLSISLQDKL